MWVLRVVGLLAVAGIGASIVAFLLSRDRRYLGFAWRIGKYALIFAFVVMLAFALERLAGMA
ncbi:MAG TPA: hypothetical protein DHV08_00895 [Rhodocyclaceae bacterium]|nr:MAG: hypothetical protein AUK49_07460 [Betaproteobacteria bacterium CG2_30_68_42]PJA57340.1 MAG: hypothetical protein CO164_08430 [Rhodocyclales bacterium CG_4_9_14_3_um_filter_68_10]HCX32232.1 hypothetical protein [Rhodocyclaceae bacterium]